MTLEDGFSKIKSLLNVDDDYSICEVVDHLEMAATPKPTPKTTQTRPQVVAPLPKTERPQPDTIKTVRMDLIDFKVGMPYESTALKFYTP